MKKLTATIFASLLTAVGINAAHAEIASSKWVENQIELSEATIEQTTNAIKSDVQANADAIKLKQDALKPTENGHITIEEDGTIFATGLATESALTVVKTTAEDAATAADNAKRTVDTLMGDGEGSIAKQIETSLDGYATTEYVTGVTDSLLSESEASETYATKDSVTELESTVDGNIAAIEEVKDTADAAIPTPTGACADYGAKCVLTVTGTKDQPVYGWELIERGTSESNPGNEE